MELWIVAKRRRIDALGGLRGRPAGNRVEASEAIGLETDVRAIADFQGAWWLNAISQQNNAYGGARRNQQRADERRAPDLRFGHFELVELRLVIAVQTIPGVNMIDHRPLTTPRYVTSEQVAGRAYEFDWNGVGKI